ncbi:Putative L-lactate dehydrogenase operon regulatory protein [Paraburkholderia kirstenboschensis]|uniref:FadR/GntR family transcriptional regulator n=1 Tax=Paraburkholderia kirstenboschensis TaxID=1245436 RepID=UPI000B070CEF|nr:FadR/GntR family transcriptional regulator [Paraburkholderia kirstenboschensis]CAD6514747.1 Putative L-lactate dehydrogenase operon regulatory protein [Paraburkholderia kirstenboschensis]
MELKSVQPRRLYHLIGDQIRAYIATNHLSTGDRLPPERDLAQQLNVSRPSVREALIALEIQGVVEIRMGAGVFVRSIAPVPDALRDKIGDSPSDIMQARAAIEGCVASLACARLTDQGLARLQALVADMRRSIAQGGSPVEADRQFHICIAEIAQNAVFTRLVGELFDERHAPIAEKLRMQTENASTWSAALVEHERIVGALCARDPLEAQAAMRSHLRASEARWVGSLGTGS